MSGYFDHIDPIKFEGVDSDNPLAFKYDQAAADAKLDAAFSFFEKLGQPFFCFHDVDIMAEAHTPKEHVENLAAIVDKIEAKMDGSATKLLWGTANMFSHPRFMAGASTNPNPDVAAFAALQVKHAMEATHRLGGAGYVFWGGREGYDTILNTNVGHEMNQLGRFLNMAVEHKHKIGFKGDLWIEPKPHEPTKHQYDRDVGTVTAVILKMAGIPTSSQMICAKTLWPFIISLKAAALKMAARTLMPKCADSPAMLTIYFTRILAAWTSLHVR